MRSEALFINGIFEDVLTDILKIQGVLPEMILFLQPYAGKVMVKLRDDPPTVDNPMRLYLSITTDLPTVRYTAEIVGWDDKRDLSDEKRRVLTRILDSLQPGEEGVYNASPTGDGVSINLLHIRRVVKLSSPFNVSLLNKVKDGTPVSPGRTTSGGWAYVERLPE